MVSIIVPIYNVESYLDECIHSIVKQTYTDWECILVNDGSTDKSGEICDTWAKKDQRLNVIHQTNQGVSSARNKGIQYAKGEYITFIDSDDWIEDDYIETLTKEIAKNSSELIVSGVIMNFKNGDTAIYTPEHYLSFDLNEENIRHFIELNEKYLLYSPYANLYHNKIIKGHDIKFKKDLSYGEDLLFNYQYLEHVKTITCINKSCYHYRISGNNTLSGKLRYDQFKTDYAQWQVLKFFYQRKNIWNKEAKILIYRRLWGIIYDGLFLFPKLKNTNYRYIKHILSITEIEELKQYKEIFSCNKWIKQAILHRQTILFYLFFKFKSIK